VEAQLRDQRTREAGLRRRARPGRAPHAGPAVPGDAVQAFYDRHPYPRPVADLERDRLLWRDPVRRRADYHLLWPTDPYREDEQILIAGCGTSQAARYAIRNPAASVTAIDVSSASLDHTRELQRQHGLTNLEIFELPVERAHELERSFDRIVCTGVLHHLRDPDAGLRALRGVLKRSGAIHLMVYASYGRAGIYMLQEYCRRMGVGDTDEEIRDLVAVLRLLPRGHPLTHILRESPDVDRPDALADALLNPRDQAYTVSQLFDYIERNGLRFGRWYRQAPYLPQCGDLAQTAHGQRLAQLPGPAAYAAVELLRGTLARHSVVAYRDDSRRRRFVGLDDDGWHRAVPLRLPHTLCVDDGVEHRLPPGAAAVLLNQSHQYPDLICRIGPNEKRLLDAIDGHRTIAEVARHASFDVETDTHRERVKAFFERLWWYDQVVFDLSAQPDSSASATGAGP